MGNSFFLKRSLHLFVALLVSLVTNAKAEFPQSYQIDEKHTFEKRGEYRYVYKIFFKLYDAALFAKSEVSSNDILNAKVPFHLEFRYLRTIEKSIILESADKMLERNLTTRERQLIADRVEQLNAAYKTVKAGDSSSLSFIPEQGTELRINGKPVVTIQGDEFARLYFQIWLGEQPISEPMKMKLLGIVK